MFILSAIRIQKHTFRVVDFRDGALLLNGIILGVIPERTDIGSFFKLEHLCSGNEYHVISARYYFDSRSMVPIKNRSHDYVKRTGNHEKNQNEITKRSIKSPSQLK